MASPSSPVSPLRSNHTHYISALAGRILEGFKFHPYIFMLKEAIHSEDPVYPFVHQIELLATLLARRPIRVLIGDEIGLGKTVVAIMILKYLMEVGDVRRTIILLPRSLIWQWLGELKRFGLARFSYRLERSTFDGYVSSGFPEGIYVASLDWAKRERYKKGILSAKWNLVIVDEAHRVGKIGSYETLRYEFVKELVSSPYINVLFLTATPHRGKAEDYLERIRLLDPYLVNNVRALDTREFYTTILNALVFRRTKREVNDVYEGRKVFKDCKFKVRLVPASDTEKAFHTKIIEFLRKKLYEYYNMKGQGYRVLPLLLVIIAKRTSSSPRAAMLTLDRIIARRAGDIREIKELEKEVERLVDSYFSYSFEDSGLYVDESDIGVDEPDSVLNSFVEKCPVLLSDTDISELRNLHKLAGKIARDGDSRLKALTNIIVEHLDKDDKIVVFTEYADTANYLYEELSKKFGGDKLALVTSREIKLPGYISSGKPTIEDVKNWLRRGRLNIVVSTDFASEGLNLHYANVVVHYEPTWSPVKIVQRIGRVWRVGQTRDVYSYSILLEVESDISVLEILYAKLLSWLVSGITKDIVIGEELEIDMLAHERPSILSTPISEYGKAEYSEYTAILEFLRGKENLKSYVENILAALKKLRDEVEYALRAEDIKIRVKNFLDNVLGGLYGANAEEALRELLIALAKIQGYNVEVVGNNVRMGLREVREAIDSYGILLELTSKSGSTPSALLVEGDPLDGGRMLYLYEVKINVKGKPSYSEVLGLLVHDDDRREYVRGARLLKLVKHSLENVFEFADSVHVHELDDTSIRREIKNMFLNEYPEKVIFKFTSYMKRIEEGFSRKHARWEPKSLGDVEVSIEPITRIYKLAMGEKHTEEEAPPPYLVKKVEEEAMRIAMEYEKNEGRNPKDVSMWKHYDIESFDPKTNETRYIEVKGLSGFNLSSVRLTNEEFEVGEKLADKHWLYIVLGVSKGKPLIISVRDPVHKLKWKQLIKKDYILSP